MIAALNGAEPIIRVLLPVRACACLRVCACARRTAHADLLRLQKRVSVTAADANGDTPLHFGTCAAQRACYAALTACCLAAGRAGHLAIVQALHRAGGSLSAENSNKSVPLHFAAAAGAARIVSYMLEHGPAALLQTKDSLGQTPLHAAACSVRELVFARAECVVADSTRARARDRRVMSTL